MPRGFGNWLSWRRVGLLLAIGPVYPAALSAEEVESPHWRASACVACHSEPAPETGPTNTQHEALCESCHDGWEVVGCPHVSDVDAGEELSARIGSALQGHLADGRVVCTTCHDPLLQCQGAADTAYVNAGFLRAGPHRPVARFCFECHDQAGYGKLNPHATGSPGGGRDAACSFCHLGEPLDGGEASNLRAPDQRFCTGCHEVFPHPLSMRPGARNDLWSHLVTPSTRVRQRMQATEEARGIRLPLDPSTGEISCSTCHDPHDVGVTSGSDTGPFDSRLRLRNICEACHDM